MFFTHVYAISIAGKSRNSEKEMLKVYTNRRVSEYQSFVFRNIHILDGHPVLTWQQAINEKSSSSPFEDVQELLSLKKIKISQGIIHWTNKSNASDPCALTIANLQEVRFE